MELTRMTGLMAALLAAIAGGGSVAWWLHRRTRVSPHCLYLAALPGPIALIAALASRHALVLSAAALWTLATMTAAALGRRWRLAAMGAGGELREFEQARIALWRALARRARAHGRTGPVGRTYIASQGELIRERAWPTDEPFVPMNAAGGGRLPRRAGRHVLIAGATGSGKTVSARRWLLARILADGVGVIVTDPKGDRGLESDLRAAARLARRPFVLFDPRDPDTDRSYTRMLWMGLKRKAAYLPGC